MNRKAKKILSWILTMAMVLGLMPSFGMGGVQVVKADTSTYTFDATTLTTSADKEAIAAGVLEGNTYFSIVGKITKRLNSGTSVKSVELEKNSAGAIAFTVTGTADVTVTASSTGGSNTSHIELVDGNGTRVENNENIIDVVSTSKTEMTYTGLGAGTYQLVSPEREADNRNTRVYSIVVVQNPNGGGPLTGTCPTPGMISTDVEEDTINVSWTGDDCEGDGKYEVAVSTDDAEFTKAGNTTEKTYAYKPAASGTYWFSVYGVLGTEKSVAVTSSAVTFTYPLATPVVSAAIGDGTVTLSWNAVKEADGYEVRTYLDGTEVTEKYVETENTTAKIEGLTNRTEYTFTVAAVRNAETKVSEEVAATPKGTEGEFDAVPGMRIINQDGNLPLLITRDAGDITALQNATSGGFSSGGLSNVGFLLTTDAYSGDFTITADVKIVERATTGTSGGIFLGAFTGTESSDELFTVAARNDGNTRVYYSKYSSGSHTNSATGTTPTVEGTYTVSREAGVYTAKFTSADGTGVVTATSGSKVPVSDALATGEVYIGFGAIGVTAEITNLKITAGGTTVIDAATMTGSYAPAKKDWAEVAAPVLGTPAVSATDSAVVEVPWTMAVGLEGADKFIVTMYDANGNEVDSDSTTATAAEGTFSFVPTASGNYTFKGVAERENETSKESAVATMTGFVLPIAKPAPIVMNAGGGDVKVTWEAIPEATSYKVEYMADGAASYTVAAENVTDLEYVIEGLTIGTNYSVVVTAVRGTDATASDAVVIAVADKVERPWQFAWFGTSTGANRNTCEVSADKETVVLNSCTYKEDGTIDKKGGKFESFFDGISYYYTEVDPEKENFVLTATFHVDYQNPSLDGQEGFGIIARDSLGEHGVSSSTFMTNSATIYATRIGGLKNGFGTRFVTGLTPELVEANATTGAKSVEEIFNSTPTSQVHQGESYTLTLKKTNTGFHAVLNNDESKEIVMYDNYCQKLTVLDEDKIYVGFAAARGCNVTITDISFTTSDPATDPEAIPEPQATTNLSCKVSSPAAYGDSNYELVFEANADGEVSVAKGSNVIATGNVKAGELYRCDAKLSKGENEFEVTFKPVEGYVTADGEILNSYEAVTKSHTVTYRDISTATDTIYVTPDGTSNGDGTRVAPLDIYTAVTYAKAGQTIVLADGTYDMSNALQVARGVDGTASERIVLMSEEGGRAVLDFSSGKGYFKLGGSYWHVYGIDVCNAQGNVKGMQISGNNNIVELVNAYNNGDTGIQISGNSAETKDRWPANNLVLNCTSYNNCDPGHNNADGFAAKLTCGEGNVFRGCIAYNNLDDGWDLYSKVATGPIGAVTIENCVAYRNGTILDGSASGDGNGFKLGGDGIAVEHVLKNSIAYENDANGVTSNSDPAVIILNNTSVENGGAGYTLYGKGNTERTFVAENNISYKSAGADTIELASLYNSSNYFDGINADGVEITDAMFVSMDTSVAPGRKADGSIDMHGLYELIGAPAGAGAVLEDTPGSTLTYDIVEKSSSSDTSDDDYDDDSSTGSGSGSSSSSSSSSTSTTPAAKPAVKEDLGDTTGAWQKDDNGWWYQKADKSYPADSWLKIHGAWYLFGNDGYMKTGWQKMDNKWYYLDSTNGDMKTGWMKDADGHWYMLDAVNGDMKLGWYQDVDGKWYFLDLASGFMKTGWIQTADGKWYFLNADGSCAMNTVTPDGYRVDKNGAWIQ